MTLPDTDNSGIESLRLKIRLLMVFFIVGLALSGITAFPLLHELNLLCRILGVGDA